MQNKIIFNCKSPIVKLLFEGIKNMYKKFNELVKSTHLIFDDEPQTTLIVPSGLNKESLILYIEALLNFVELNALTINTAKTLFQDSIDMLKYRQCAFGDSNEPKPEKADIQDNGRLKYAMYKEHNISSGQFVNRYKICFVPFELQQDIYFEMLMQLDDFIREKDLTVKQAKCLLSDCAKLLLYSM